MICVDASLVLKWITPEEDSSLAFKLYRHWKKQKEILVAPVLLEYEVGSVLCKKVRMGLLASHRLIQSIAFYRRLAIQLLHESDLIEKGLSLAQSFEESSVYDCVYLALAQIKAIDFYTCDKRFFEKVQSIFPQVRYFKEA